ncbi:hypothetical protein GCM10025771_40770 [Niveibacterium umoris]|uniref:Peptidoglycan-associated lipoprotein n=1 Tax=Niveibacterium umoris TaxID=1193620 RepID=A0A840BCG5_9RHOO|nr:peptidoglycan-associated lipoprotein Pal [Niveibacterium umoris]MBB4010720.1 peptidoglycan-associated lipoprotein [Niveibacterium umoris]
MLRTYLLVSAAALLAACSTTPTQPVAESKPAAPAAAPAKPAAPAPAAEVLPPHRDPNSELSKNNAVYFAYDKYVIEDKYKATVDLHAKYLVAHPELNVRLEGNADERGSREYNLALGNKRATAVQSALGLLGVKASQMEAVSFGEDKPLAIGHDEDSWAQNRRTDIVYPQR